MFASIQADLLPGHIIGSFPQAIIYAYHGLGPILWFLSLWRQGVEWKFQEEIRCHLETIEVPLAENWIQDIIWFCLMYPPFLTSMLISKETVKMLNGVLHYSTGTERSSDVGFSSCTVPTLYSCLRISGAFWGLQGFWKCWKQSGSSEVIWNWSIIQRGEHRDQV